MNNSFPFITIVLAVACLALGAGYAWLLYRENKYLPKKIHKLLSFVRFFTVGLIAFMLFAPLVKTVDYKPQKPIIVLAKDNSLSVGHVLPKGFNAQQFEHDFKALEKQLATNYDVRSYSFSDSVSKGLKFSNNGKLSNGTLLVNRLADELENQHVGAVVVASDGIFNRGGNPVYELEKIDAPVYTVALGDTIPKRDVMIANINYNNLVYLDNGFNLDVQVQSSGAKGEQVKLSVAEDGKLVKEQLLTIDNNAFIKELSIPLTAKKVGMHSYRVAVSSIANEITVKNNSQTAFIEVIDGRQKVLLASWGTHPDLAIIKQALERNKHYQVVLKLGQELAQLKLGDYSMVIAYQLPAKQGIDLPLATAKVPVWYILGAQTDINAFNKQQAWVKLVANGDRQEDVFPLPDAGFNLFMLEPEAKAMYANYDPLQTTFGNLSISASYQTLLKQKIGSVATEKPLLFYLTGTDRKMAFLMGEGLWRWRLNESKVNATYGLTADIISNTAQYLATKDDKRKFKVYTTKNTFDENENVVLNAILYNDSYQSITSAEVKLVLTNQNGKSYNATFSALDNTYRLDMGNLPEGSYTYKANAVFGQNRLLAQGAFAVNGLVAEYQQTTANHQLLKTMAQASGGQMLQASQLLQLQNLIAKSAQAKTVVYEDYNYRELIHLKWIFFLILLLLSLEWFLRKRNGEI